MKDGTILVVDDDALARRVLADTLASDGFRVLAVESGAAALDALATTTPDLCLLDVRLPTMDGFELMRRIRARPQTAQVPVMFVSVAGDPATRVQGFRLGAVDFVDKPFHPEELLARVATHVDLARLRRAERLEAAAREASIERRFVDIVNTTDGIVWEADASTFVFTFVSEKAERLLGYPAADWSRPGFWVENLHPDDRAWAPAFCVACTGRLEPHDFEYRFIAADGRVVWLRDIVTVVPEGGKPRWLRGVMVDVTEQKRLETQLRDTAELLAEAQRLSKVGGWRYDCATHKVEWTEEVYRILGLMPDFDASRVDRNLAFYHPEDAPRVARGLRDAAERGVSFDVEARLRRADGVTIWVRALGRPEEVGGRIVRVVGYVVDVSERKAAEEQILSMALYDPLTRLPNRRLLFDRLGLALAACARDGHRGALLFVDLDNFKTINDTFGHDAGDALLQEAATRMRSCVRETDTVARLGGDEFVVMLERLDDDEATATRQAMAVGDKLLAALGVPYLLDGRPCLSTPSIGVTLFDAPSEGGAELLRRADRAMYQAKNAGRNAVCLYVREDAG